MSFATADHQPQRGTASECSAWLRARLRRLVLQLGLFGGEALLEPSPRIAFENAGNRSIFITHGTDDDRVDPHHFEDMLELAADLDVNTSSWLVEGTGHTEAIITDAEEYEQRITDFFTVTLT